ncbi:MAG: glycosyltransferase family 2 protein [bacterium]|nr:glycosyltransferase family 2 protein [bacterium]
MYFLLMKKTCSCIVPFYNEEKRILGVLSSLLESKYIDEIIVVNDGSTDQGKIVVVDFIQNKKKISFVDSKVNKGKSHAVSL